MYIKTFRTVKIAGAVLIFLLCANASTYIVNTMPALAFNISRAVISLKIISKQPTRIGIPWGLLEYKFCLLDCNKIPGYIAYHIQKGSILLQKG